MSDIQKLYIDLDLKENLLVTVNCKQLDNLNLILSIWDNGIQADLNNYRCRLKALKQDQVPLIQNTDITINNNEVNIASDEQLTTTSGIVKSELQFIDKTTGEKKSTFNLNIKVIPSVLEVDRTISVATITLLQELDNKLDEIEDIGNVLDEAKTVKSGLESDITNVKNIKENLDSSISTANTTKTFLDTSNINANNTKMALDASNASANSIKASLETTITNAENKKQEIVTECALADQKISAMQGFGDITVITQDVSNLKTEIQNARNGEVNLDARLDKFDASLSDSANKIAQLSNPSLLINDCFQVWQRGTSFNITAPQYMADRWYGALPAGGSATMAKINGGCSLTLNGINSNIQQAIEDYTRYQGKKVTATIKVTSITGTMRFFISDGVTPTVAEKIAITAPGVYTVTGTVSASASQFKLAIQTLSATMSCNIEYAKLELGSIATPFVPRPYGEELALCQRYYEKSYNVSILPTTADSQFGAYQTLVTATGQYSISIFHKIKKRINPTITIYSYCTGAKGKLTNLSNGNIDVSAYVGNNGEGSFFVYESGNSNLRVGDSIVFHWDADAEIY